MISSRDDVHRTAGFTFDIGIFTNIEQITLVGTNIPALNITVL